MSVEQEAEIVRLRWLVEWINEHASFTSDEWPVWERLERSPAPWDEPGADT